MYREGNNRKKFRNISITKLLISQSTTFIIIYRFVQAICKYNLVKLEQKTYSYRIMQQKMVSVKSQYLALFKTAVKTLEFRKEILL